MSSVDDVASAVAADGLVVIPTDTVYGLACRPDRGEPVRALSTVKGRSAEQPIALVAGSIEARGELVPELAGRHVPHGPFTLVLPNPARRLPWLTGAHPETIGVRLPVLGGEAADLLGRVGAVAATSANLHGGADPCRLADVPRELLDAADAVLDGGELPGTPSTVVDLTGPEPRVLREGAITAAEALATVPAEHPAAGHDPADVRAAADGRARRGRSGGRCAPRARARARARRDRAHRVGEFHLARDARGGRQRADEQVLRGLSGPPLLRRL